MSNPILPQELADLLCENQLFHYKIIGRNIRKGRWCVIARTKNNKKVFIKWNSKEQEYAYKALNKEKKVYILLADAKITPELISCDPLFVLDYIEGSAALREYMQTGIDNNSKAEIIETVLNNYLKMLDQLNQCSGNYENLSFKEQMFSYLSKLMTSGPEGTHIRKWEKKKNRIYSNLLKRYIASQNIKEDILQKTVIHGDFHLNNTLITKTNNALIIDFENVIIGNATLELAYWYAQMWLLLFEMQFDFAILDKKINEVLSYDPFQKELFWRIVPFYKVGISMNSRFYMSGKKMTIRKRIVLIVRACIF